MDEEENDKVVIKEKQRQKNSDDEETIEVIFDIGGVKKKISILEGTCLCHAHLITCCCHVEINDEVDVFSME